MSESHVDRVAALRAHLDDVLAGLVADREPAVLYEPVEHVLRAGGKRVRPIVLLLVAQAYGTTRDRSLPAALAVEVFHNFTLVHDDIMDEDLERRGRPTVHAKWDPNTAILVGDLMMGLSFELLGEVDDVPDETLHSVFHPMVRRLCAGQALDTAFETQERVSGEAYLDMIDRKTGALLAVAFELGAVIGGAPKSERDAVSEAGRLVGRAFQIQDDLLDLVAEEKQWGKAVGRDLVAGKKTFLTVRALEKASGAEYDWFARIVTDGGLPEEDVLEARERMESLGVFEEAETSVTRYTREAHEHLKVLPDHPAADTLRWLLEQLKARTY